MKAGREDAAVEKDVAVEAVEKPAVVIAAVVGAAEGAVTTTGGGAPSAVTALAAVIAVQPVVGSRWRRRWRWIWRSRESSGSASSMSSSTPTTRRPSSALRKCRTTPSSSKRRSMKSSQRYYSEDDEDVDDSKESRDNKSRYVLRRLRNGEIPYRSCSNRHGNVACLFCYASIKNDYDSLIMHGTDIGRGNGRKCKPHVRAKKAAFGAFLGKYAKGHLPFYLPRPPRLAKMPRI
ncbi:hypothetical protein VPH35_032778 [Triticum aestivum]